jgi:hypothetical protein
MKKYTALFLLFVSSTAMFAGRDLRARMQFKKQSEKIANLEARFEDLAK